MDPPLAIQYLTQSARNSGLVESQALASGMKKGGAAKGELVLAIYELGNCFRNGWGVEVDIIAALGYFEVCLPLHPKHRCWLISTDGCQPRRHGCNDRGC